MLLVRFVFLRAVVDLLLLLFLGLRLWRLLGFVLGRRVVLEQRDLDRLGLALSGPAHGGRKLADLHGFADQLRDVIGAPTPDPMRHDGCRDPEEQGDICLAGHARPTLENLTPTPKMSEDR